MNEQGWIKLHRKSLKSSVFENEKIWKVWCWCLMRANHADMSVPFNGKDVEIKAGQFITGRAQATGQLKMTPKTYRTCITYLKTTSRVASKSTNRFTIFTVLNWSSYQHEGQQNGQPRASQGPAKGQPKGHRQEVYKNVKNDKKDILSADSKEKQVFPDKEEDMKNKYDKDGFPIEDDFEDADTREPIEEVKPPKPVKPKKPRSAPNPDIDYLIAKMKEIFGLKILDDSVKSNRRYCHLALIKFKNKETIEAIMRVAAKNDFWKTKITSFSKLYYKAVEIAETRNENKKGQWHIMGQ